MLVISSRNDSESVLHNYPRGDCSDTTTIRAPSIQVSTFRANTRYTFVSAAERFVFSSRHSTMAVSMQIFVLGLPTQRTLVVPVHLDDTMEYIEKELRDRIGIASINFRLCHMGKCFPSGTTVRESAIKPLSTLTCVGLTTGVRRTCSLTLGNIYVRTSTGKIITTDLRADTIKVKDVKAQIETSAGILCERQRLSFAGPELGDLSELAVCGISHGSTMQLVVVPQLSGEVPTKHHSSALPFKATEPRSTKTALIARTKESNENVTLSFTESEISQRYHC